MCNFNFLKVSAGWNPSLLKLVFSEWSFSELKGIVKQNTLPCPSPFDSTQIFPLWFEIIFLQHYFKGKFVVENVIPFYTPLITAKKRGRHLYWTNFNLPNDLKDRKIAISSVKNEVKALSDFHDFDFKRYKGEQRVDKMARNLVDYEAGKTIFETVLGIYKSDNANQTSLF